MGVITCTLCAAGTYRGSVSIPHSRTWVDAMSVKVGPFLETTICTACGVGTYSTTGAASCSVCPANSVAPNNIGTSSSDCICNSGYGRENDYTCSECPMGTYSTSNNAGVCTSCAANTYSTSIGATSCVDCPTNTVSPIGSDELADCIVPCGVGTQRSPGTDTCVACPASYLPAFGLYTEQGACSVASCEEGYEAGVNGSQATCDICKTNFYCSDGVRKTCLSDTEATFAPGRSSAGSCQCGLGRVVKDGECSECLSVGTIPDYRPEFIAALNLQQLEALTTKAGWAEDCTVRCIKGWTGSYCQESCDLWENEPVLECTNSHRHVACESPWRAYCTLCDNPVPDGARRVGNEMEWTHVVPMQSASFENALTPPLWLSAAGVRGGTSVQTLAQHTYGDSVIASLNANQRLENNGARGSQGFLQLYHGYTLTPLEAPPRYAVVRMYVNLVSDMYPVTLAYQGQKHRNLVETVTVSEWTRVVAPWHLSGLYVDAVSGFVDAIVGIDELRVVPGLLPPYLGVGPQWCPPGLYGNVSLQNEQEVGCLPCPVGHACFGDPGAQDALPCPNRSRPLPMGSTCVCADAGFKTTLVSGGLSLECTRCPTREDCSRGYARGTITTQQVTSPNKPKQLSCGPLGCCTVDWQGNVLCWGDNSKMRLGSSWVTQSFIFAQDAFPVQGLHIPATAVAVSQSTGGDVLSDMSCALLVDGTVQCWGTFEYCVIDDPGCATGTVHVCVPDDPSCGFNNATQTAVSLRVASGTACVATHGGEIWCWGRQLWHDSNWVDTPTRWDTKLLGVSDGTSPGLDADTLVDFVLGERFMCAVYGVAKTLRCAGRETATDFSLSGMTLSIDMHSSVYALSSVGNTLCVARYVEDDDATSEVDCYGLSDTSNVASVNLVHTQISGVVDTIVLLETGVGETGFACATVQSEAGDQSTLCWGDYPWDSSTNMLIDTTLQNATTIALGSEHACAVLAHSEVICWGEQGKGRLGVSRFPVTDNASVTVMVPGLQLYTPQVRISWEHLWGAQPGISKATLPQGAAISHRLEIVKPPTGHHTYDPTNRSDLAPIWHWVYVEVVVSCDSDILCWVVLARNLQTHEPRADSIFFRDSVPIGESGTLSAMFWALYGDSVSVFAEQGHVTVTSVLAFEDSDSCPFECGSGLYMRNGDCVACDSPCGVDQYSDACVTGIVDPAAECHLCDDDPVQARNRNYSTEYVSAADRVPPTECYWRCVGDFFWTGVACQAVRTTPCAVGQYLTDNTDDQDAQCESCIANSGTVFISDGGTSATGCAEQCTQDSFFLSLGEDTGGCRKCSTYKCGTGRDWFTDSYKTTIACGTTVDVRCLACVAEDVEAVTITASGDDVCAYSCMAGMYPIPVCGAWDEHAHDIVMYTQTNTTLVQNTSFGLTPENGVEPGTVLRMRGEIRVTALTVHSNVSVWGDNAQDGAQTPLTMFTPRVSVSSHEAVWERVDIVWVSSNVFITINPFETVVELRGLSILAQTQSKCVDSQYKCDQCPNSSIPMNASFVVSENCEWVCEDGYERQSNGVCLLCPLDTCGVGEYMSACGECAGCVNDDPVAIFTSSGLRGLNASCTSTCPDNNYNSFVDNTCYNCSVIETCGIAAYPVACSSTKDTFCEICTMCAPGRWTARACNETDTVCSECTANLSATGSLPENAHWLQSRLDMSFENSFQPTECAWECTTDYIHDEILGVCKTCTHECPFGEYESECTRSTQWEGCMPCTFVLPNNATWTGRGRQESNSCPWQCLDGFVYSPGTGDTSGICLGIDIKTPPPTSTGCTQNANDCALGTYLRPNGGCVCDWCTPLQNASIGIAQFTTPGTCEWACVHPYLRSNDICVRLKDLMLYSREDNAQLSFLQKVHPLVIVASVMPFMCVLAVACMIVFRGTSAVKVGPKSIQ
jgi:hypothetical protein